MLSSPRSEATSFSGRHLFVTGGTGFLGRSLLDYLIESACAHGENLRVTILTRDPARFLSQYAAYGARGWLNFISGDIASLASLPPMAAPITDLIHAAADTHRVGGNKVDWLDQIVDGTRNVLDFARKQNVARMLYVSSGAVYGAQPKEVAQLDEDCPRAPLPNDTASVYGTGKRMAEHLCALYGEQHGLPCVTARCFAILSRHIPLDGAFAAGNFIRDALRGDAIKVKGNGHAIRTYLDGRDCAHWLATLLQQGAAGQAYNVGSDVPISVLALAERIAGLLSPQRQVIVESTAPIGQRSIYVPCILKSRSVGLEIETSLERTIVDAMFGTSRQARASNGIIDTRIV